MSSQLSYRLHGREQGPKTLRKHYRDELDTGQVKASAKEPRACSASRLVMGRSQFSARAPTASSGALRRRTVSSRGGTLNVENESGAERKRWHARGVCPRASRGCKRRRAVRLSR